MIRYTKGAFQTLLYWWGGINRHLILNSVLYLLFLVALFWAQSKWPIFRVESSTSGLSMLGSLTVFLLVFRMNQSMARNNEATERTDEMFGELDFLIHSVCSFMQGAKEDCLHDLVLNPHRVHSEEEIRIMKLHGELASMVRTHVVRLTIAFGVSCLLYFRILTALADAQGVLEEEDLVQIVFLHSRLQALLYEEEMELVDQYMGISRETDGGTGSEAEYRAETGRFRIAAQCSGLLMRPRKAGNNEEEDCRFVPQSSDIIPPLPKVILSMLVETCHTPLAQKWGYPERVLNLIASISADALDQLTHLSGLIARPVSLAYYQHCRVIVVIFSFMLPLVTEVGEDLLGSIFDNIVFPFVIYWAMSGLERLAEMMENPVGDDDTDINLLQQLHELEVGAQLAIELCENRRSMLRRTLAKVCPSCSETSKFWKNKPPLVPPIHFEDYFCWLPIPAAIAEGMVMKHGHVDHVHWAFFEGHIAEFRTFLRKALRRHTPGRRSAYEAIPQDASAEELKVYPEAEMDSTMGMIQRDTNQFWHYLAFRPVLSGLQAQGELSRQALWKKRIVHMLGQEHPASLLLETESPDSARSVLLQPLVSQKPRRHHVSEAMRELSVPRGSGLQPSQSAYDPHLQLPGVQTSLHGQAKPPSGESPAASRSGSKTSTAHFDVHARDFSKSVPLQAFRGTDNEHPRLESHKLAYGNFRPQLPAQVEETGVSSTSLSSSPTSPPWPSWSQLQTPERIEKSPGPAAKFVSHMS